MAEDYDRICNRCQQCLRPLEEHDCIEVLLERIQKTEARCDNIEKNVSTLVKNLKTLVKNLKNIMCESFNE